MIHRIVIAALVLASFPLVARQATAEDVAPPKKKIKLEYVYLTVVGAKTDPIARSAQQSVEAVQGVRSFTWTSPRKEAKVVRIVGQAGNPALISAFEKAGVRANAMAVVQKQFSFKKALHCGGCVIKVKRAVKALKGTKEVNVAKDKLSVTVVYDSKKGTPAAIEKALAGTGYPVAKPGS